MKNNFCEWTVYKLQIVKLFILILLFSTIENAIAGKKLDLNKKKIKNIIYHYHSPDSLFIKNLSEEIEYKLHTLQEVFGNHHHLEIEIFFPNSVENFNKLTGGRLPDWSGAVAFSKRGIIILKPRTFTDNRQNSITITHELVHVFIARLYQEENIPLWIHEGLATYLSKGSISWNDGLTLANAIVAKKMMNLDEIEKLLSMTSASANLAYLEAQTAAEFLIQLIKINNVPNLLAEFEEQQDINKLFQKKLGIDFDEFEYLWQKDLENRFKWMVVLNFDYLFWILLVFIVIIAYVGVKIRNYRKIRKWESMEINDIMEE